ncbi:HalOD1 output domain-containing protein [Natronobiforma cellulositropha]|uniref:HalOD1 output domain-containing protein n=1 Tax=Natronobiforma cellulositropha TaxID=1679076 RepID=UPI0021D5DC3F|nr:HalOD1 output domain-containing protein [Natronobiforma cellulositropha]
MYSESTQPTDEGGPTFDQSNDRYVYRYDPGGSATLPTALVHAIATVADVDVSQGEFSLYDSIDPDALERLFSPKADGTRRVGGHVAFTALEHAVYVYADGTVFIYPPEHAPRPHDPDTPPLERASVRNEQPLSEQ